MQNSRLSLHMWIPPPPVVVIDTSQYGTCEIAQLIKTINLGHEKGLPLHKSGANKLEGTHCRGRQRHIHDQYYAAGRKDFFLGPVSGFFTELFHSCNDVYEC